MKKIHIVIILILNIFLVSCSKDAEYYSKHPEKAREKINECYKDISAILNSDKDKAKECKMASEGLEKYTEKTYKDKSYKEIDNAIKEKECSIISLDVECLTLNKLKTEKYEEYKSKIQSEIREELNKKYADIPYQQLFEPINNELLQLQDKICFNDSDECIRHNAKIEELSNILKLKADKLEKDLKEQEIARYNKMSIEEFSAEVNKIEKLEVGFFADKTLEEKMNRIKKQIMREYKASYLEKAKKERYDNTFNKYKDYSFKDLIKVEDSINKQFKTSWFTTVCFNKLTNQYEDGIFCDIMQEDIKAINDVFNKTREREVEKEYKKLKEKYKNEAWNKFLTTWLTQHKYPVYSIEALKSDEYYNTQKNKRDITSMAMTKLYLEKRAIGEKELASIPNKDLLSKEKTYCLDTRSLSACDVFRNEASNRIDNNYDEFVKAYSNLSLEQLQKLDANSRLTYYKYLLKEKTIKDIENMKYKDAEKYYNKVCRDRYSDYNYKYCDPLAEKLSEKEQIVVNYYINNPEKIKEIVNNCYQKRNSNSNCNLREVPYNQVRKAMRELGSYTYEQTNFEERIK